MSARPTPPEPKPRLSAQLADFVNNMDARAWRALAVTFILFAVVAVMLGAVILVVRSLPHWLGLVAGIVTGAVVFLASLRITRSLEAEDWERLGHWAARLPDPIQRLLRLLAPRGAPQLMAERTIAAAASSNQ